MLARKTGGILAVLHMVAYFADDDDIFAPGPQSLPKHFLGHPLGIDFSRIKEIDTRIQSDVDQPVRLGLIQGPVCLK